MINHLREFEEFKKGEGQFKNAIILAISTLILGFWLLVLVNFFSSDYSHGNFTDFYIITGGTLVIGTAVYFFARSSKIGWFLLTLIIAFFLGLFIRSAFTMDFDFLERPEAWRKEVLIVMSFSTLIAFIFLVHVRTKKRLSISKVMYVTCIVLCGLVVAASSILVS